MEAQGLSVPRSRPGLAGWLARRQSIGKTKARHSRAHSTNRAAACVGAFRYRGHPWPTRWPAVCLASQTACPDNPLGLHQRVPWASMADQGVTSLPWKAKGSLCLDRGQAWLAGWLGARALAKPRHVTAALIPPIGQPHVLVHSATEATRGRLAGQLSAWPARQLAQIIPWVSISESLGPPWRTRGLPGFR